MIVKEAVYKKIMNQSRELVSKEVYGCDECKKEFIERSLQLTVFRHDTEDTDRHEFCSWACVFKFIPTIKTDYFVDLPYLMYDPQEEGATAKDFIELIS